MQTSHQACLILPGQFVPQSFSLEVERRAPVVSRRLETKRAERHLFLTDHQRTARGEVTFMEMRKMRGSGWSPDRLQTGWSGTQSCVWVQASNQTSFSSLFATSESTTMVWRWADGEPRRCCFVRCLCRVILKKETETVIVYFWCSSLQPQLPPNTCTWRPENQQLASAVPKTFLRHDI